MSIEFETEGKRWVLTAEHVADNADNRDATEVDLLAAGFVRAVDPAVAELRRQTAARDHCTLHAQLKAFQELGDLLLVSPGSTLSVSVLLAVTRLLARAQAAETALVEMTAERDGLKLDFANVCGSAERAIAAGNALRAELERTKGELAEARAGVATMHLSTNVARIERAYMRTRPPDWCDWDRLSKREQDGYVRFVRELEETRSANPSPAQPEQYCEQFAKPDGRYDDICGKPMPCSEHAAWTKSLQQVAERECSAANVDG